MDKIKVFKISIDNVRKLDAISIINKSIIENVEGRSNPGNLVVTPNLDHLTQLLVNKELLNAYNKATLVITDGFPIKLVSQIKLKTNCIKEVIPGSELTPEILNNLNHVLSENCNIAVLGSDENTVKLLQSHLELNLKKIKLKYAYTGFVDAGDKDLMDTFVENLKVNQIHLVIGSLGAPKQEIVCSYLFEKLPMKTFLCVGATIEFLIGSKKRAPLLLRKIKLEWLHRWISEPIRLSKRYMLCFITLFKLLFAKWSINK
jgi:N-acetylglucosaminyldiphosphoundecaprenol N-acetyl-beta-D-mannosaminyltransferase